MSEIWKDVVGYEGRYQVSDLGRVKSLPNSRRNSELVLKQQIAVRGGYPVVGLISNDGSGWKQTVHSVHRLVLIAFRGPAPEGMEGCHNDGDPTNCTLDNLRWDTDAGNQADRLKHGTSNRGERNGMVILTEAEAAKLKRKLVGRRKGDIARIARETGLNYSTVRNIAQGNNWAHLET